MGIKSINPATGELIKEYSSWHWEEVSVVLDKLQRAWTGWRELPMKERSDRLIEMGKKLREEKPDLARTMTLEMGKPIRESLAEIEKCALACEHYASHAAEYLKPEIIPSDAGRSYVRFDPLGVILAIMPWNFPFWQVFRFAAPAVMAGNAVALKHASNVTWSALMIEGLFRQAGFPEDLFRTLLIGSDMVGEVIADPRIAAVTLTGSRGAGAAVAAAAGKVVKKTVLELGGSDPFIVLADADLELTIANAVTSRMINTGQSCIAAKRFIVERPVYDRFVSRFKEGMEKLVVGDPLSETTQVGPLARPDLRDELHRQVSASVARGARVVTGGKPMAGTDSFYPPTILAEVGPGMPAWDEELFGPVAAVAVAGNADEALRMANDSRYGLGASIWTSDIARGEEIASRIEAGAVFVNGFVKSDPRLPFGGVKESGYGRELSSFGIREMVNIKTVWVR